MEQNQQDLASQPGMESDNLRYKQCTSCKMPKLLADFLRRTGKRSGKESRRGTCKACRKRLKDAKRSHDQRQEPQSSPPRRIAHRPLPAPPPKLGGPDASILVPNRQGILRMRGRTDKGRRWQQETDLETAVTLVREHAAIVINRNTVLRVYSNKTFRQYILQRDQYTCYFCGEYGDTIDHLLPRAKGGHTTPVNCVCACMLCNQSKADLSLDDFMLSKDDTTPKLDPNIGLQKEPSKPL
ncbi:MULTISPECIES: HNH endonuclease [unclassified Paenibacillus]|uniref:HNH endonuclease n=1 Tax=unclassified Paenibacillus TaxID=185978 RepID=UPI003626142F